MQWNHPIHPYRFNGLLALVQGDHWHAHVLDRLIYRCQQSTLTYRGQQAFTEPLEDFAAFVEATSVRNLQYAMTQLEKLGLLGRQGTFTDYGSQCILWLTPKMWAHLTDQQAKEGAIAQPADNPVTSPDKGMYQAENLYRYTALTSLLGGNQKGRVASYH